MSTHRLAFCAAIAFATSVYTAQVQHEALKQFLGLSAADLARLEQARSRSAVNLTDTQRRQLDKVASVLGRAEIYEAVSAGLINASQWPGTYLCNDEGSFLGLQLSSAQMEKLQVLRTEPLAQRLKVLTDAQLKRLDLMKTELELVNEAIDLGLVSRPAREPLCH